MECVIYMEKELKQLNAEAVGDVHNTSDTLFFDIFEYHSFN